MQPFLSDFLSRLTEEERSPHTVEKYLRDVRRFLSFAVGDRFADPEKGAAETPSLFSKDTLLQYKQDLAEHYAVTSANSMLAALNVYLKFIGRADLCLRPFKVQRQIFCREERELTRAEYLRLVAAAGKKKNERLSLLLQTICSSGIRVSELESITVEAAKRGKAVVRCKNKTRTVLLIRPIRQKLLAYCRAAGIRSGAIFITSGGKPLNRSNIWREMKGLCREAGVSPSKVFPHNLRHLFARTFYGIEKDIAKLADILGHSNINTTRIYTASTGSEHLAKMERMCLFTE